MNKELEEMIHHYQELIDFAKICENKKEQSIYEDFLKDLELLKSKQE